MVKKGQENLNYSNILGAPRGKLALYCKRRDIWVLCGFGGKAAVLSAESDNLSMEPCHVVNTLQYDGSKSGRLRHVLTILQR